MKLFIGFFLLSSLAFGTDILSVGLSIDFKYADYDTQCNILPLGRNFTLSAELDGSQITRAKLRKNHLNTFSETLELNEEEMRGIEIVEVGTHLLVKNFTASHRMLEMLFRGGSDQGIDSCSPPERLATIQPGLFTFDFKISATGGVPYPYIDSTRGVFQGTTESGKTYRIELALTQDRI